MNETIDAPERYPKYSDEYFLLRGRELFESTIRDQVEHLDPELHLYIDIESGEFAVGADTNEPYLRLLAKNPNAQILHRMVGREWTVKLGSPRPLRVGEVVARRIP